MSVSKSDILKLYKSLHRYGQNLKYTDKDYFYQYIRGKFQETDKDTKQIENLYKKGNSFLAKKRLI